MGDEQGISSPREHSWEVLLLHWYLSPSQFMWVPLCLFLQHHLTYYISIFSLFTSVVIRVWSTACLLPGTQLTQPLFILSVFHTYHIFMLPIQRWVFSLPCWRGRGWELLWVRIPPKWQKLWARRGQITPEIPKLTNICHETIVYFTFSGPK